MKKKENGGMGEWGKELRTRRHGCSGYYRLADIKLKLKLYCNQPGSSVHLETTCHGLNLTIVNNNNKKKLFKYVSNLCCRI